MAELLRLVSTSKKGHTITRTLTDTHLHLDPRPEFREEIQSTFQKALEGAAEAPRLIGWIVEKTTQFAPPDEAFIFDAKLRQAREALNRKEGTNRPLSPAQGSGLFSCHGQSTGGPIPTAAPPPH